MRREKLVVLSIGALAALVLLGTLVTSREWVLKEWLLYKLRGSDEEERWSAAERLERLDSAASTLWYAAKLQSARAAQAAEGLRRLGSNLADVVTAVIPLRVERTEVACRVNPAKKPASPSDRMMAVVFRHLSKDGSVRWDETRTALIVKDYRHTVQRIRDELNRILFTSEEMAEIQASGKATEDSLTLPAA
jgi:hypothetical protein